MKRLSKKNTHTFLKFGQYERVTRAQTEEPDINGSVEIEGLSSLQIKSTKMFLSWVTRDPRLLPSTILTKTCTGVPVTKLGSSGN